MNRYPPLRAYFWKDVNAGFVKATDRATATAFQAHAACLLARLFQIRPHPCVTNSFQCNPHNAILSLEPQLLTLLVNVGDAPDECDQLRPPLLRVTDTRHKIFDRYPTWWDGSTNLFKSWEAFCFSFAWCWSLWLWRSSSRPALWREYIRREAAWILDCNLESFGFRAIRHCAAIAESGCFGVRAYTWGVGFAFLWLGTECGCGVELTIAQCSRRGWVVHGRNGAGGLRSRLAGG